MLQFARGKRKYKSDCSIDDIYKFYASKNLDPVSSKVWKEITQEYNKEILRAIIYDHIIFTMPFRLGKIRIRKHKKEIHITEEGKVDTTRLTANCKKTKAMWEAKYPDKTPEEIASIPIEEKGIIYILNEHTDGYTFKFYWDRTISDVKNQTYYVFKPVRKVNREINIALAQNSELQYYYFE